MSLSKFNSINDNKRRDSFRDRVCDDLSEVILQFLPIEDKFRFECVSKQFQRTVFQRHFQLFLKYLFTRDATNLEILLKKLPHIRSLSGLSVDDSELELIIKYCNDLTEFNVRLGDISDTNKKLFIDKFGPQLTSISDLEPKDHLLMDSLVNIKELYFNSLLFLPVIQEIITKTKPKNLKKLSLCLWLNGNRFLEKEIKDFKALFENIKSVTHLKIYFVTFASFLEDDDIDSDFSFSFGVVSHLDQLVSLRIKGCIELISLTNDLKQLSANCLKLKKLSLRCNKISNHSENNDFMTELKKFKELKRFDISCNDIGFDNHFLNSFKTGFKDLTHLKIDINIDEIKEEFIENIANNLPNLQKLVIRDEINTTEHTEDIVSRLSKLETLELILNEELFSFDSFEKKIRNNCRKIKTITINGQSINDIY